VFLSIVSFVTSCLMTYIGYLNFLRVRDDLTMNEEAKTEAEFVVQDGATPEAATTFRLLYDFVVGTRSHKSNRCATQAQALRTVLRVSLVVSILYLLQALGFLYKLMVTTMELKSLHSLQFRGSYYFVVLVVYQLPEFFPSLVIMHSVSSPTSVFRRPLLMTWDNMCALAKCEGKAGFTSDHSLCMLIVLYSMSCCGSIGSKRSQSATSNDADEEDGQAQVGARPVMRRVVSVSEDISADFDDERKIELPNRVAATTRLSNRPMASSSNPLHKTDSVI
jgi:hypothetical protein